MFAQLSWTIWFRRNQLRTSSKPFPIEHVIPDALTALSAFIRTIPPKPPDCVPRPPQFVKWCPPKPNLLKVNFDGAVFREENSAGVGVIIRDTDGRIIASMVEKVPLPNSVAALEAVAAIKALYFAAELGISSIVLEGDSEIVIKALVSEDTSFADHGHLVEEAKLLSTSFIFCSFSHVKRQGNSAAHHLSRHVSSHLVWMENVPPQLLTVTLADMASIY